MADLETTAEEREAYAKAAETEFVWPEAGFVERLLRDFDRLVAEIASLKARLAEAEVEKAGAVKAEREACAKIARQRAQVWSDRRGECAFSLQEECEDISAAIRARGGSDV